MRAHSSAILGLALLIGAGLRALRVGVRWDELTLAYAAYMAPLAESLGDGHPTALVGDWIGLHPPLYGTLYALIEVLWPVPMIWLALSALASLGAVAVVGRVGGPLAAMVLATAPVHLMDSAEVNNYPLASLAVALLIWAAPRAWPWLAAAAVLAAWSHILGGLAAMGVLGWRLLRGPPVKRWPLITATAIGMLPILGGALRLMQMESTWSQPTVDLWAWAEMVAGALGPEGLLLAPIVALGLRRELAWGWLAIAGALGLAIVLGAAAAHQRPYLGLLAPIAAVAVGQWVRARPSLGWLVLALCLVRAGRFAVADMGRAQAIGEDMQRERAVDLAVAGSAPGDTLWLVAPALQPDDDKTDFSSVMWRFSPWQPMPIVKPVPMEYKDYRFGHPRQWRDRVIHTSTELDAAAFDAVARQVLADGHTVWVVLYDHSPASGLKDRVSRTLRPYVVDARPVGDDLGLGVDWLFEAGALR